MTTLYGDVVYPNAVAVSNLTSEAGFAVALFAQWDKAVEMTGDEVEDWLIDDLAPRFAASHGQTEREYWNAFKVAFGSDYAGAFHKETGKVGTDGMRLQVWHDYVAGTDPLDVTSVFKASLTITDGKPVLIAPAMKCRERSKPVGSGLRPRRNAKPTNLRCKIAADRPECDPYQTVSCHNISSPHL